MLIMLSQCPCTWSGFSFHIFCDFPELFLNFIFVKQIRVLLSRAHAISKLWDDAPLVLCGDFNSTPKVGYS